MKFIVITGPSGSGKTTLSQYLNSKFSQSIVLNTDNYYKTAFISKFLSNFIRGYFDKLISFDKSLFIKDLIYIINNKSSTHYYKYDFRNKRKDKVNETIEKVKLIIIEGIFSLEAIEHITNKKYLVLKLDIEENICSQRIIYRDYKERGKDQEKAYIDFRNGWNIYKINSKKYSIPNKKIVLIKSPEEIERVIKKLAI